MTNEFPAKRAVDLMDGHSRPPNVIVCMCDQLRAFEVGCYGNEHIRTPHIDRLAREGVRFEHAVTNNPVCMPARSCFISGQYSRTCMGSLKNYTEQDEKGEVMPDYPVWERKQLTSSTIAEEFKKLGYATALFGKWHVHPAPEILGFDYSLFPRVHHRYTGQTFIENRGTGNVVEGFSVEFEAERVAQYLKEHGRDPFFMYYNISPPHMPLADAPSRYLHMYSPDEVPLRPNVHVNGRLAYDERWFKIYLWDFLFYMENQVHTHRLPHGFDLRQLIALYYGLTTWVDDTVGRLMNNLRQNNLGHNTVVVFLSDHGDHLGSHHLFNKETLVEEAIRIPLIFHAPWRFSPRVNRSQVAQIIDVMPTLLEFCGAKVPPSIQGRNLVPLIFGEKESLESSHAMIETSGGQIGIRTRSHLYGLQLGPDLTRISHATREIRTECRSPSGLTRESLRPEETGSQQFPYGCISRQFKTGEKCKLKHIEETGGCFFDLQRDPYEQQNLLKIDHDCALARNLREELLQWHTTTPWLAAC